jgi:LysR family cys regulon transcriptional activator
MSGWVLDDELVALNASHLFAASTTKIGFRRGTLLRGYMYEFIELFAPHLKRELVDKAIAAPDSETLEAVFAGIRIPTH